MYTHTRTHVHTHTSRVQRSEHSTRRNYSALGYDGYRPSTLTYQVLRQSILRGEQVALVILGRVYGAGGQAGGGGDVMIGGLTVLARGFTEVHCTSHFRPHDGAYTCAAQISHHIIT